MAAILYTIDETRASLVIRWSSNNLPTHVKGVAYWKPGTKGWEDTWGYYIADKNPKTRHNEQVTLEFIRNQNTKEDNWYILKQPRNSCHWYTDDSWKIKVENNVGLGWWKPTDPQHPNYTIPEQPRPSSQSALAQPESAYTLGHKTLVHEEFLAGALHQVAFLKEKQTLILEPKELALATAILQSTLAGVTFELSTLKTQLLELYITAPAMSAEANTMITTQNLDTLAPLNGNSLLGSPPKPFDGNRDIAKEFMCFYKRW